MTASDYLFTVLLMPAGGLLIAAVMLWIVDRDARRIDRKAQGK